MCLGGKKNENKRFSNAVKTLFIKTQSVIVDINTQINTGKLKTGDSHEGNKTQLYNKNKNKGTWQYLLWKTLHMSRGGFVTDELVIVAQEHVIKMSHVLSQLQNIFFPFPYPIFPICVHGTLYPIYPQFINQAVSHLWWGPRSISVAYFIFLRPACVACFMSRDDILPGSIVNHCVRRRLGEHLGKSSKHRCDGSPDIRPCQDACPRAFFFFFLILRNAEMLFWDLSCTSGQDKLFFSFPKQTAHTYTFRSFTDVIVCPFVNKSPQSFTKLHKTPQSFTLCWRLIGKRCCFPPISYAFRSIFLNSRFISIDSSDLPSLRLMPWYISKVK